MLRGKADRGLLEGMPVRSFARRPAGGQGRARPRAPVGGPPTASGRQTAQAPPRGKKRISLCFRIVGSRTANPWRHVNAISFSGRRSGAKTSTARLEGYIISQHGNTIRHSLSTGDRQKSEVGKAHTLEQVDRVEESRGSRTETQETRPQPPCWWREHGSERP